MNLAKLHFWSIWPNWCIYIVCEHYDSVAPSYGHFKNLNRDIMIFTCSKRPLVKSFNPTFKSGVTDRLTDWQTDRQTDWLTDRRMEGRRKVSGKSRRWPLAGETTIKINYYIIINNYIGRYTNNLHTIYMHVERDVHVQCIPCLSYKSVWHFFLKWFDCFLVIIIVFLLI